MIKSFITIITFCLLFSCYSTKHINTDEYLLKKNSVIIDSEKITNEISKQDIHAIIKQKPNKKIIGLIPFHLWVHNVTNPINHNWVNSYLRKIGEAPIVLNEKLVEKSISQIKSYFDNYGYFTSIVDGTTQYKKNKAYVSYDIKPGNLYLINGIKYSINKNQNIENIIHSSTSNSEIKKGDIFTYSGLNKERNRLGEVLQNNGYYKFSQDYIYIKVDTFSSQANIEFFVKDISDDPTIYQKFKIKNIFIHLDDEKNQEKDTILHNGCFIITKKNKKPNLKFNIITDLIKIRPNNLYARKDGEITYENLSNLSFFKKIKIEFIELNNQNNIDCNIYLATPTKMYYSIEAEAKRLADEGSFGVSGNLQFGNNNLFKGAENLNGKIRVSLGNRQTNVDDSNIIFNTQEISYEISLRKPKLILPKKLNKWLTNSFQMSTNLTTSITQRKRPDFSSQTITQKLGYNWKNAEYKHHHLNIIELSYSKIDQSDFISNLIADNIYLQEQFEDKFIPSSNYVFTFNNQRIYKIHNYTFFRSKIETSGNLFQLLGQAGNLNTNQNNDYIILQNPFSQYAKIDLDFRRYLMFTKNDMLVLRTFFGTGYAYGNSEKLPIQKQFFSGGVNSIRAWEAFDIGPGSTSLETDNNYATGDLKLEFNIEYRFTFINSLKSAIFLDAGNIWTIKADERAGSTFKFNSFIEELAVGAGLGFRYDFDFFVIRLDLARPLRDPSKPKGERWVENTLNGKFRYNLAIGYPF